MVVSTCWFHDSISDSVTPRYFPVLTIMYVVGSMDKKYVLASGGIDIFFSYSGPSGILGSEGKQNTA